MAIYPNIMTSEVSPNKDNLTTVFIGNNTQCVAMQHDNDMFFAGHTTMATLQNWLSGEIPFRLHNMIVNAINNRTRERNFSRLNEQLASGEITELEFNEAISEHSDKYVIRCDIKPTEWDLKMASILAPDLLDVSDTDDLAVLFSFDEAEIRKYITK